MRYAYLRIEGGSAHPDDARADLTPEQYERQLRAYISDTGDKLEDLYCSDDAAKARLLAEVSA